MGLTSVWLSSCIRRLRLSNSTGKSGRLANNSPQRGMAQRRVRQRAGEHSGLLSAWESETNRRVKCDPTCILASKHTNKHKWRNKPGRCSGGVTRVDGPKLAQLPLLLTPSSGHTSPSMASANTTVCSGIPAAAASWFMCLCFEQRDDEEQQASWRILCTIPAFSTRIQWKPSCTTWPFSVKDICFLCEWVRLGIPHCGKRTNGIVLWNDVGWRTHVTKMSKSFFCEFWCYICMCMSDV